MPQASKWVQFVFALIFFQIAWREDPAYADNPKDITESERPTDFKVLFNGRDLYGWRPLAGSLESSDWRLDGGSMHHPGGIGTPLRCLHTPVPRNFEICFEWKEARPDESWPPGQLLLGAAGAEVEGGWKGWIWCAYNVEAIVRVRTKKTFLPIKFSGKSCSSPLPGEDFRHPAGEWNKSRMVCRGALFQNWLNGKKVVEVDVYNDGWLKLRDVPGNPLFDEWLRTSSDGLFLEIESGERPIWFRGIKVREILENEEAYSAPRG